MSDVVLRPHITGPPDRPGHIWQFKRLYFFEWDGYRAVIGAYSEDEAWSWWRDLYGH
jgi:hypothetical protein